MSLFFKRVVAKLLPWSWQRRSISRAAEMILSNVNMYAAVTTYLVDGSGPQRLLMELRSPVAVAPEVLEQLRMYIARKLEQLLGLRVQSQRIYLVSLPPADAQALPEAESMTLGRLMQQLPMWPVQRNSAAAANDPKAREQLTTGSARAPATGAAASPPAQRASAEQPKGDGFSLPDDLSWNAQRGIEVAEFTASQFVGSDFHPREGESDFARTEPVVVPHSAAAKIG